MFNDTINRQMYSRYESGVHEVELSQKRIMKLSDRDGYIIPEAIRILKYSLQ